MGPTFPGRRGYETEKVKLLRTLTVKYSELFMFSSESERILCWVLNGPFLGAM